jgi:p-cumate 2,3-dioxygenase beta subunit
MEIADLRTADVAEYLHHESFLLDNWRLPEWRELFTAECRYLVPASGADPYADPSTTLHYIADDGFRLTQRVVRLMKKTAHAEYPRSKTLHMISNVRITGRDSSSIEASSNFATYRAQRGNVDTYIGHHEYRLVVVDGTVKIQQKRTILHMEALRPHGRITMIV